MNNAHKSTEDRKTKARFVVKDLNSTYYEAVKSTPYQAFCGNKRRSGLTKKIPEDFIVMISPSINEEDFSRSH